MRNMILAAGVAALAISVPATAKPDRDGKGRGAQASKVERGGGKAKFAQRSERGRGKAQKAEIRTRNENKARVRIAERRRDIREIRVERREDARERFAFNRDRNHRRIAFHTGNKWGGAVCPPGLAKKTPACVPPGQVGRNRFDHDRIIIGQRLPRTFQTRVLPLRLRNVYRDDNRYTYRLGDRGYVYRVRRDNQTIAALLPLIGAGLGIGMPFPYSGQNYMVPNRYQSFYPNLKGDDYYRYANGYVYEIDRNTGFVENMIPLLDNGYGVGQMLPASYSTYNVPYQYRSSFYDTPNAAYRYAPGAIYQVDPTTQLITAVASLLAPGLGIGQQLPSNYSAYNVPMGYRSQYYDTPDSMYRYANNNIYRVDPTTQLITSIVASII